MFGCLRSMLHFKETLATEEWCLNCHDSDRWSQCIHHVGQPSLELSAQRRWGGRAPVPGPRLHPRRPARCQDHHHAEGSSGKVPTPKKESINTSAQIQLWPTVCFGYRVGLHLCRSVLPGFIRTTCTLRWPTSRQRTSTRRWSSPCACFSPACQRSRFVPASTTPASLTPCR